MWIIKSKLNGYKNQEVKRKLFDRELFINYDETIEKIMLSKLRCYYCKKPIKLIFKDK